MKRIYKCLKIILGCLIVALAGYSAYQYYDYRMNPSYYAQTSFPWYTSIVFLIMFMLPVVAVILLALFLLRRKIEGRSQGLNSWFWPSVLVLIHTIYYLAMHSTGGILTTLDVIVCGTVAIASIAVIVISLADYIRSMRELM